MATDQLSAPGLLPKRDNANRNVAITLVSVVALMVGAAYASVPLYQLFCKMTGFGGTTQRADGNPKGIIDREMTVRFDANVDNGLDWTVLAAQPITGKIGSVETVVFKARNNTNRTLTGQAIFNVTPEQTGIYFNKIQCFCFTQQSLKPGEVVDMPVTFFVDPDIAKNGDLDTVKNITLSYTFYPEGR
jgi:cytochrome c oxidase assembly protein subunit 11